MAGTGLFTNIKSAKMSGNFTYVTAGNYWMRINKIVWDQTRTKEQFVSVIMTVIKVFPSSESLPPHRVGEEVNHYMEITGNEYFLADMKGFVAGAFGAAPEEVTPELADQAIANGGQMMAGMVVEMHNKCIMTKAQKAFTKVKYTRPIPPKELYSSLTPQELQTFFPPGFLERQMAAENQQGLAAYQQAPAQNPMMNPAAGVSWNPQPYQQAPQQFQQPQMQPPMQPQAPAPYPFPAQLPPQVQAPMMPQMQAPSPFPQHPQMQPQAPMPPQYQQPPAGAGFLPPRQ